jgi:hypothetical protein
MPEILWALLLICALLMLLAVGPARSPPFDKLTAFTCDSPPASPVYRGNRGTSGTYYYTCRSDHQVAHLGTLPVATNTTPWRDCRRSHGTVMIWRPALPSPYGGNVFQVTCNAEVIVSYEDASSSYESRRAFVAVLGWCLLALSAAGLVLRVIHLAKRRQRTALIDG